MPLALEHTRLTASAGYLREMAGANGAWARVAFAQDLGPAVLFATVHGEHMFTAGRDAIDLMLIGGASVRVASHLRLGLEYVAQDVEAALDPEEVEGMRHFVSPTVGLDLLDQRLSLTAGPAFGLSKTSPSEIGRLAASFAF
jgi:hypothetical protein